MNGSARGLQSRIVIAAVVAIAAVAAFASLGGVGLAKNALALAQYQYGKKVTVCHKGKHTLTISAKAWPAHQRHNDTLGACATTHKANKGKHKGESHHAPNPASGSGATGSSNTSTTQHGKSGEHGNGNDKDD
jgi:hypothetical protein